MSEGCSNGESNTNKVLCGVRWITVEDIENHYGMHRKCAAAAFNVSESTFRRKYNQLGIKSWPYPKRKSSVLKSKVESVPSSSKNSSNKESCEETSPPPQMEETSSASERKNDGTIGAKNIPNSIIDDDVVDHVGVESVSAQPLNSVSSIEDIKLVFKRLVALPLEDISHPDNETSMNEALSILENNLTMFSKEQAEQILVLLFDFPTLVHNWREYYSRSQTYNNLKRLDETEKIRDMVKTWEREEEILKLRYEELEKEEKELMTQLAAVQKEKAELAKQRIQKSKELMEKEAHRNKEERLTRIATAKLNNLSQQWAELQSSFI